MKKKILSLVLVVAMLASMMVFAPVSGATETKATLAFTNATGAAGDTVTVDLVVTTSAFKGMQFVLDYDDSKLTFDGITWTDAYGAGFPVDSTGNEDYAEMFKNSPYEKLLGWSTGTGVDPFDATDGVTVATLTFTINADAPVGDAVVGFAPATGENNKVNYGDASWTSEKIEFVNGAITVLPEGYASAISIPEENWDIDEDGILYGLIANDKTLAGSADFADFAMAQTGALVIPSQIAGIDVVEIEAQAFDGWECSTIVVPESVEALYGGAIANCFNLTKAYVLGADTALDEYAIGYECTFRRGAVQSASLIVNGDDTGVTVIYGVAGSAAETYAADSGLGFVAEGVCSVTFNGNTYLTGAEVAAPGVMTIGDQTVIGWTTGEGVPYAAGATMTLEGATTLTPVTITTPKMNSSVAFHVGETVETSKMRFTTVIAKADVEALAGLGKVSYGTIITPAAYVSMAGGLTKEALTQLAIDNAAKLGALPDGKTGAGLTYIDVAAGTFFQETETTYTYAGSLAGFKAENIDLEYAAAFYATVELADGSSFTVYSAFDFGANRSVGDEIVAAKSAQGVTDTVKEALDKLYGLIVDNK